jgi:hypothetical protein
MLVITMSGNKDVIYKCIYCIGEWDYAAPIRTIIYFAMLKNGNSYVSTYLHMFIDSLQLNSNLHITVIPLSQACTSLWYLNCFCLIFIV